MGFPAFPSTSRRKSTMRALQAMVEAIHRSQAVIEFSMDGTILSVNRNFVETMGYDASRIVGRHHRMFVASEEQDSLGYADFWKTLRSGAFTSGVYRRIAEGGREVWLQASYSPVLGADGRPEKIVKFATDVTAANLQAVDFAGQIAAISLSQAVITFALDGTILDANENFLTALGYQAAEIVGRHHSMFVEPTERGSAAYAGFWSRLAAGEYVSAEFKRVGKDGREVWIQASYNPIFGPGGRPFKVVKFASDITAIKLLSADNAGQLAAIGKSQAVISFAMDGTILEANENFLATVGYTAAEVVGRHHAMFMDAAERAGAPYKRFWERLRAAEYVAGAFRRIGKNGREVWIQASYNPILDPNGHAFKVVKYATDITEVVQQRKRTAQLSLVADGTDNAVIITDAQRRIEYVNPGFERMSGYKSAEVVGKSPGKLLQGVHTDPEAVKRIRGKLNRGEAFYEEVLNYTKAGEPYWISLAINAVHNAHGEIERFISISTNVNETKQKSLDFTNKLETINESNALAEWSPEGRLTSANATIGGLCGLREGDAVALDRLVQPQDRDRMAAGESVRTRLNWPTVSGEDIRFDAVFSALRDLQGKTTGYLMCGTDVSAQRRAIEETNRAMGDLKSSGERIASIVSRIDNIAFQTNILSLNAAVEAARAGETGKGFAIVAAEVRALASQSAQAARDINGLVLDNVARMQKLSDSLALLEASETEAPTSAGGRQPTPMPIALSA